MGSITEQDPSSHIPLVDFSSWTNPNSPPSARLQTAQDLVQACHTTGFVYLINHGVPTSQIATAFSWSQAFFALPDSQKTLAGRVPESMIFRGYNKIGEQDTSTFDSSNVPGVIDFQESYDMGSDANLEKPNVWIPEEILPGYRAFMHDLYGECWKTAELILRALALGLGLGDEKTLLELHSKDENEISVRHYPAVEEGVVRRGEKRRLGAHSDFDSFTLLWQDQVGGLEILIRGGEGGEEDRWEEVKVIEGAVLMNIGDVLERWTNDYLRSTKHRVHLPSNDESYDGSEKTRNAKERYSMPFFVAPVMDTVMKPLEMACAPAAESKYEPITFREYLMEKTVSLYKK